MSAVPGIAALVDEGAGNTSYLVDLGDGRALVVDPSRDPGPYLATADRSGLVVAYAAETHLHADFVSGARELAAATGAQHLAPVGARLSTPHRALGDGEELALGGLTLRVLHPPGHTPEHVAYVLLDGERPLALFSGGTLIAGGVARTDLLGPEHTEPLARAAHRSITQRLLVLPDDLPLLPTHGAGSFCSTGSGHGAGTVGDERRSNPLLGDGEDAFVTRLLAGYGTYPPYFLELRDVNRDGAPLRGTVTGTALAALTPEDVDAALAAGTAVVDVRPMEAFAAGHVPRTLSVPLRPQFSSWLGWLVSRRAPVAFVVAATTDRAELVRQCRSIGFEDLAGALDVAAWTAAGREVAATAFVAAGDLDGDEAFLDVRQANEWSDGHVGGAAHVELAALAARPALAPDAVTLVAHCGHGERAMTAASVLERAGRTDVKVLLGGPRDIARRTGRSLVTQP